MAYPQTLDYLYSRLPVFQHIGKAAYKADLNNTIRLCAALGNPERKFKSIHVAGTNGKGSTSSLLASIFTAHGYKTGLYTSPHLKDFRERIRIDGRMVPEEFVVDFTEKVKPIIEEINPSFFEITVTMAFSWFAEQQVDMAIVEVGMGGRLDSTNVIMPELSVITNIGWDHVEFLGDTLAKIASEKAGIIKQGIPTVIGEWNEETEPVFEAYAHDRGSELIKASVPPETWPGLFALKGNYQKKNLATVYSALNVMGSKGYVWDTLTTEYALQHIAELSGLRGRWEKLGSHPLIVADVAHNEHGLKPVMEQFTALPHKQMHVVLGVVNDKDLSKVLPLFPKEAHYYFSKPNIIRGLDAEILANTAADYGLKGNVYPSVENALENAKKAAGADDIIFVGGSTFVVAEVIP